MTSSGNLRIGGGLAATQILFAAVLVACGRVQGPSIAASPTARSSTIAATEPPGPTASKRPNCQNPDSGRCLNNLPPGTYTTERFTPTLTYTVPDGWANYEDDPGNFLLLPPGGNLPGVNGDTSDFVGAYTRIAAPNGCNEGTAPGIGFKPEDLKGYYGAHPGLDVKATPTSIGGRDGIKLEVRMKATWTTPCIYSNGNPVVPMIVGLPPSGLEHNIGAGRAWHLYLLERGAATLAIEVVDVHDGAHLADYAAVVAKFVFGPG